MDNADEWEMRQILGADEPWTDYEDEGDRPYEGGLPLNPAEIRELYAITKRIIDMDAWADGLKEYAEGLLWHMDQEWDLKRKDNYVTRYMADGLQATATSLNRATIGHHISVGERGRFLELAAKAGCRPEPPEVTQVQAAAYLAVGHVGNAVFDVSDAIAKWWKKL